MRFYIGQKVVCVYDNWVSRNAYGVDMLKSYGIICPKHRTIYTARGYQLLANDPSLLLFEIKNDEKEFIEGRGEPGFDERGFVPLYEGKTDISVFTAMLNNVKEDA